MAELLNFTYTNGQPHANFEYDDDIYDLNWRNTTLYVHCEPYKEVDHIFFVEFDEEDVALGGLFMFRQTIPNFSQIGKQLIEQKYRSCRAPLPADGDLEAWTRLNTQDLYG